MKTILAPIDFSPASNRVIKAAVNLTRAMNGRLVLLHVVQLPVITSEYGAVMANFQEIIAVSEKSSRRLMARHQQRLAKSGLKARVALVTGAPALSILEHARKTRAAYLVMGSHGHSALFDLLAGSTTTGVLRRSPCPVLVVPPAGKKSRT
jgi:nucleotide-binding universal stress UspA family protein